MTKIDTCGCVHTGQDKLHGKGNRVFNKGKAKSGDKWTCTACGKVK